MSRAHARRSLSQGMNFWPGYVDALTNVVLNLLFMVAMFGIAITVFNRMPGDGSSKKAPASQGKAAVADGRLVQKPAVPPAIVPPPAALAQAEAESNFVVADAFSRRSAVAPRISKRTEGPSHIVLSFDLPGNGDPVGLLNRASVRRALANSIAGAGSVRLWAAADAADPVAQKTAYLALITMRNHLISLGINPATIDVRVYPGVAAPQGGLRLFLASMA